ncbi:PEP/pyruvate-binding domain-containing protein [Nesterenkonia halobia]|uniref:PEP/pyruvate-binding domain-containing protein n=1 Tax=Nesterenkonia halobia TaxID=37922 RepID=A0ABP6REX0_9MICC
MSRIIDFTHDDATRLDVSGGKGASLAKSARELPVPPGVIVTAETYAAILEPVRRKIRGILQENTTEAAAEKVQELLLGMELEDSWVKEVDAALEQVGLADRAVAVRSSGTMEDLPGAAFAGQHDTFLGERGATSVARAVLRCYASLWNIHAMKYRDRLGLDHLQASMAVVVQQMVEVTDEEAAGVAFSIDPVRGDLTTVLVNASYGLGETVVGGEAEVDEYLLSRDGAEERGIRVASKPAALVVDADGGTREVDIAPERAEAEAIDADMRAEVARLAVQAEDHYGFPQDIEWAVSGGDLFLLQSRPITRVAARWTRDESAERYPNPVTPLTWDLVETGFHASLRHSFQLMGLPPFGDKWFAMRDFYIYGNQTAVELYSGRFPTAMFRDIDSIRQSLPDIARQYGWVQDLPVQWMRDLDTYLLGIGRLSHTSLEDKDLEGLWDHVREISDLGSWYFLPNIAISLTQSMLYKGLLTLLSMKLPDEQAQSVFDQLVAQTDTKTGQVNDELWQLSRAIRATPDLLGWLDSAPSAEGRMDELRAQFPAFASELDVFLERHGHRELDFDAYHPTWVGAPHIVVNQLRVLAHREAGAQVSSNQLRAQQAEAERQVLDAVPDDLRYFLQEVIRLARTYTALDDLEHYQTTRLNLPMRRALSALGQRLVEAEALDEPDDVYFLHVDTLEGALREGSADALASLRPEAQELRAGYRAALESDPDWVHGEADADLSEEADMCGTAGSTGQVEAEVFVVHSPDDFPQFPVGAILIARTTNPAWTALFYQAAGVITESGGALSHGAVTARELGIPAVMGIRDATRRFTNGQRVRMDGGQGTVALV